MVLEGILYPNKGEGKHQLLVLFAQNMQFYTSFLGLPFPAFQPQPSFCLKGNPDLTNIQDTLS